MNNGTIGNPRPYLFKSWMGLADTNEADTNAWMMHSLAGGSAAAISKTVTAPLDRIKTYLQTTDNGGVRKAMNHIYHDGGVRSFWRGNGLNLLKTSPEFAIKFTVYDLLKKSWVSMDKEMTNGVRFVAGAVAGGTSQGILYPLEIIKTRLMVGKYSGTSEVISTTWKKEGLTGFFKGYVPHTLGMLVFTGIDLTIYEMSKNRLNGERLQWSVNMASAICSSTVAHCTCYPISMLTTKFQANNQPDAKFMDLVKHNWKTSGALGMYRGFLAALVKMLPGMTISYVAYEELCSSFGVRM